MYEPMNFRSAFNRSEKSSFTLVGNVKASNSSSNALRLLLAVFNFVCNLTEVVTFLISLYRPSSSCLSRTSWSVFKSSIKGNSVSQT